jgi:hypothetical protein
MEVGQGPNWGCSAIGKKKREIVTKALINPIIRTRTGHFRRAYHPTRDSIEAYYPRYGLEGLSKTAVRILTFRSRHILNIGNALDLYL